MEEKKKNDLNSQTMETNSHQKEINLTASVSRSDIFHFLLYHNYARVVGIIGFLFSSACLIGVIVSFGNVPLYSSLLLLLVGSMFTIYQPAALYGKAMKQSNHPVMKKPMNYKFGENGMSVSQEDNCATVSWDELWKIVVRKRVIYIFMDPVRANIIPRLETNEEEIIQLLELARTKMPASHVKGK